MQIAVDFGIKNDPRGPKAIKSELSKAKEAFKKLSQKDKEYYDQDRLINPYADTRILYGKSDTKIETVLVGVDMETSEILLADRLRERGEKIDLVMGHHPEGRAYANFSEVMGMQADILHQYGVPINVAEGIMKSRIKEVAERVMPANHQRPVEAARLLDIPYVCIHTPADNSVTTFLQKIFDQKDPQTVEDVLDLLKEIPEFQASMRIGTGPQVLVGSKDNRCGKIFVDMTGGTGGSKLAFEKLAHTDRGTVVGMHIGDAHKKEAEKNNINVVIAGHMSSDSLGINLILDELLKKGLKKVICCSGVHRVSRLKQKS